MEDKGILFSWNGALYSCRCDHCLLSSDARLSRVSYDDAEAVVVKYLQWREQTHRDGLTVDLSAGYSVDFPQLLAYIAFRVRNRMQGADSLQVGGIRKRSGDALWSFLDALPTPGSGGWAFRFTA